MIRLLLALLMVALPATAQERTPIAQDALSLPQLLRDEHVSPFWLHPPARFDNAARALEDVATTGVDDETIAAAMLTLIATIGDGHTVFADRYTTFGIAPFFAEVYDDGLFLGRVPAAKKPLLGAEIVAVGGVPIADALSRLRGVVPHSTENRFRRWVRSYLHLPGLVHVLGLSESADAIELTLRLRSGEVVKETFGRLTVEAYDELEMAYLELPKTARTRHDDKRYWLEPIGDDALYVKIDRCASGDEESIWDFGRRMAAHVREHQTRRVILDLRDNGGGGYQFVAHIRPLLHALPTLDHPGGVIVLTGKVTFSAACDLLAQVQRFTDATLIGQTAGCSIGEPGDDDDFALPKSGLTIRISQIAGRDRAAIDRRRIFTPDVLIEERFTDLMAGLDPVLDAAVAFEPAADEPAEPASSWAGRYQLEPGIDLAIAQRDGRWRATALPVLDTPLTALSPTRLTAAIPGLTFTLRDDTVHVARADGTTLIAPPKENDSPSAWELVFAG
ncbi:MAG: hypothetical protein AAGD38_23735, partial [Acidobacteriota bacterium]